MTEVQKAYIAGIVDGEGSISIAHSKHKNNGKRYYSLRIDVVNTDRKLIDYMADVTDTGYTYCYESRKNEWKNIHSWVTTRKSAEEFLREILPYLVIKKERAELALEFRKHSRKVEKQEQFFEKMKALNKRGAIK